MVGLVAGGPVFESDVNVAANGWRLVRVVSGQVDNTAGGRVGRAGGRSARSVSLHRLAGRLRLLSRVVVVNVKRCEMIVTRSMVCGSGVVIGVVSIVE